MEEVKEINVQDLEVETELNCGSVVIKLYKVPLKRKCNKNITCEDKQGKIVWQVEDVEPFSEAPFTNIKPFDKEKITAYNWIGMDYYIDIQTGKLELVNKNARPW
jgi:hypothetical protein